MAVPLGETLRVESPAEWDAWLAMHGAERREIWLLNERQAAGPRTLAYDAALDVAICHGWIDGMVRRVDDVHYAVRWTPRRPRSNWTEGNRDRARRLVASGRMRPAGFASLPEDLSAELRGT